jgi:multidrug efflux pump subunit AcrA (membrane-fusion protein)
MKRNALRLLAAAALLGGLGLVSARLSAADNPQSPTPSPTPIVTLGITKPSEELKLAFSAPGLVSDVGVKEGDAVDEKQVLASQESRQDELALKSAQSDADSMDKIIYSKADHDLKVVKAKRTRELFDKQAASLSEVEEADLAVKLADAQINLAVQEHDKAGFDAAKQAVKVELMKMRSPIKGIVEKINIGNGEMADPQSRDGAIVVGKWDPLWLEIHLPSNQAAQLKLSQDLPVKYEGGDWQTAKIIYFEKVDAASDTEMVRMELTNPSNARPPGLHMQVKLPDNVVALNPE